MSPSEARKRRVKLAAWIAFAAAAAAVIILRLSMTVDLAYFLPAPSTEEERVLIERLGQGPGSRLIFATIAGADADDTGERSARLRDALAESALFTTVLNGQEELNRNAIPAPIWDNRYLLADIDMSAAGLRRALDDRLTDLALLSGSEFSSLVAADPYLAALAVVEQLSWSKLTASPEWISPDGRTAFLIVEVAAPAFDLDGQTEAVEFIRATADRIEATPVRLNGIGVYGVDLQHTIRSEAQLRSVLASLAIILILFIAYRSVRLTLLAAVPLALGALAGIAGVALIFEQVHGITLAFGFTLFGVAVDYPLHLFSHARYRNPHAAVKAIWRTLRLGAFSTILAYLSMSIAGSVGLAQLGLLSAIGVLVAMYATRSLLPLLMPQPDLDESPTSPEATVEPILRHGVWIIVAIVSIAALAIRGAPWSNDLSTLTPVDPETLRQDSQLRQTLGAPDIRHVVTLRAPNEQAALEATEALAIQLGDARTNDLIADFRVATTILPSRRTQLERRATLLAATEAAGGAMQIVREAADGTLFQADGFTPFVMAAEATRNREPITAAAFAESPLAAYVDTHLYFDGNNWVSLVTLFGLTEPQRFAEWLATARPDAALVDLKSASQQLVMNYRQRIHLVLFGAAALIAILLLVRVGWSVRLLWISGTLSAALLGTIAVNAALLTQLSIFNLIALVLVAGLGLDYTLFMSRAETDSPQAQRTRHAVLVCVASTLIAFLILATSAVPILASLGTTVAIGVCLNYLLTRLGSRRN